MLYKLANAALPMLRTLARYDYCKLDSIPMCHTLLLQRISTMSPSHTLLPCQFVVGHIGRRIGRRWVGSDGMLCSSHSADWPAIGSCIVDCSLRSTATPRRMPSDVMERAAALLSGSAHAAGADGMYHLLAIISHSMTCLSSTHCGLSSMAALTMSRIMSCSLRPFQPLCRGQKLVT